MTADLQFADLIALTGNRLGKIDVPCPACGPDRRHPVNRKRAVLRVWREHPKFISYHCARCGAHGYAHDNDPSIRVTKTRLRQVMREADQQHTAHVQQRRRLARWLWDGAASIKDTPAERYLRSRGITCPLPATLRFRPARGQHPPAMIAAFGVPSEPTPGILDVAGMMVHGVHITRGRTPNESRSKIMVGPSMGLPLVLAPVNDIGGLAIAEGIEDALSLHQATGLGAWAAGCANRLPALARAVPRYVTSVTIAVDDDDAGRRHAHDLARQLAKLRGRRFEIVTLESQARAAA